jgi:hypothetical protein
MHIFIAHYKIPFEDLPVGGTVDINDFKVLLELSPAVPSATAMRFSPRDSFSSCICFALS